MMSIESILNFIELHVDSFSLISSICMLVVTIIYAFITWWQAKYSKETLLASIKQYREEKQPYIVPSISEVSGCAFDTSTYLRIQFSFNFTLENVGDTSAVTLYTFLYSKLQYQNDTKLVYAHLMPEFIPSLCVGHKVEKCLHFETAEFRDIIEDLEISEVKNVKRIETDPTVSPYPGPIIILRCLYMNMMGQWFESILEQEIFNVYKKELAEKVDKEDCRVEEIISQQKEKVTNNNLIDGDIFEGKLISSGYSKMSRRLVDHEYVVGIINDCRDNSDSKLEYLSTPEMNV